MLGRQHVGIRLVRLEDALEEPLGLGGHPDHAVVAVHALHEERLEALDLAGEVVTEADEAPRGPADLLDAGHARLADGGLAGLDGVAGHQLDQQFRDPPGPLVGREVRQGGGEVRRRLPEDGQVLQVRRRDDAHRQRVVQVVAVVGDGIGHVHGLAFQGRPAVAEPVGARRIVRRGVLGDAFADLVGQVQPPELRVRMFQVVDDADAVAVVLEAARAGHQFPQGRLAGVAERRMAHVVREGHRLREVLVQVERAGQRPGDLGHLQGMRQAGPEEIALVRQEDLRLVLQPTERR